MSPLDCTGMIFDQSLIKYLLIPTPYLTPFLRYSLRHVQRRYIGLPSLRLTPTEGLPYDDLRKICEWLLYKMA